MTSLTRTSIVLADRFSGALRATELIVATNIAMIRIFETSIFNLKEKICRELAHFKHMISYVFLCLPDCLC